MVEQAYGGEKETVPMLIKSKSRGKPISTGSLKNGRRMERLRSLTIPSSWNTDINFTDGGAAKRRGTTQVWKITKAYHPSAEKVSPSLFLETRSMPVNGRATSSCPLTMETLGAMSPRNLTFRLATSKRYFSQDQPSMSQPIWESRVHAMVRHETHSPMLTETRLSWIGLQSMA